MIATIPEGLKEYITNLQVDTHPVFQHVRRLEDALHNAEGIVSANLIKLAAGAQVSFDDLLSEFRSSCPLDESKAAEEIAATRVLWEEVVKEVETNPTPKDKAHARRFSRKFGCTACKLTVSLAFVGVGGLMGVLAAYSAGAAAPAYFVALASAVGVSVTTLYAILGAVVAGTLSVSDVPREICRYRGKC